MCKHCRIAVFRQKCRKTLSFLTLCKCPYIADGLISMINMDRDLLVELMPMLFRLVLA